MTILWLILKIILGLLGLLLILFLGILLGILFLPLEYKVRAEKYEMVAYNVQLRIFYLISILYDSRKASSINIQLLGKTIKTVTLLEEDKEDIKDASKTKFAKVLKTEKDEKQGNKPSRESVLKEVGSKREEVPRIRLTHTGKSKKVKEREKSKEKAKLKEGIHTDGGWLEDVKRLWNSEDRVPFLRSCKILFKELWYAIRPKTFNFKVIFGLENPADTGMWLAKLMPLYPFYAPYGDIIGDFENTTLEGDLRLLGKTNLFRFIKPLIVFITHKEVRQYIKIIMNIGKGN